VRAALERTPAASTAAVSTAAVSTAAVMLLLLLSCCCCCCLMPLSWVRKELHCWVFDNVRAKWPQVLRRPNRSAATALLSVAGTAANTVCMWWVLTHSVIISRELVELGSSKDDAFSSSVSRCHTQLWVFALAA
jgi:hypothetical protein